VVVDDSVEFVVGSNSTSLDGRESGPKDRDILIEKYFNKKKTYQYHSNHLEDVIF